VVGKSILNVGCVAHSAKKRKEEPFTHDFICEDAESVLGIDILQDEIKKLQQSGYDVKYGDIQNLDLDKKFEVIVLSEVIEHLTDFDGLMSSIDQHLIENGKLIITTPNILAIRCFAMEFFKMNWVNSTHTCYFERSTLEQLMAKYNYSVIEWNYSNDLSLDITDPVQTIGWVLERLLPDRVGSTTLGAVITKE
jgi:2-polyprenyl-3-methyl-5-hydroxy-6-metoxy-1,4-benzoquinol methylase